MTRARGVSRKSCKMMISNDSEGSENSLTHLSFGHRPQCLNELQPLLLAIPLLNLLKPPDSLLNQLLDGDFQLTVLLAQRLDTAVQ